MTKGWCFESIPIRLCKVVVGVVGAAGVEAEHRCCCCCCLDLIVRLEAFAVDNGWARFVVFLFADPHLLEGGE